MNEQTIGEIFATIETSLDDFIHESTKLRDDIYRLDILPDETILSLAEKAEILDKLESLYKDGYVHGHKNKKEEFHRVMESLIF